MTAVAIVLKLSCPGRLGVAKRKLKQLHTVTVICGGCRSLSPLADCIDQPSEQALRGLKTWKGMLKSGRDTYCECNNVVLNEW